MENQGKRKLFRWTVCFLSVLLIVLQCAFPAQAALRLEGMHHRLLDSDRDCRREGHLWSEWKQVVILDNYGNVIQGDCTKGLYQYRTCSACGATEYRTKEPWTHTFGPWETVRTGTCVQEGLMRHTCVDCGISEEVSTGYSGHNYGAWVEMQPATCTAQGIKYADCQVCGHREYAYTDPVPHTFSEWTVKTAATDFTTGVRKRSCTVCHLEQEEVYYPDGTVFYGDNNDIVLELQRALNRGGYDCGTPDGAFGNNTWAAITAFEGDHDLPVDGIGWPGIRKFLTEAEQTFRPSRDTEDSGTPEDSDPQEDPSNGGTNSNNSTSKNTKAALECSLKLHKAYIPEGRDYYYPYEPVVVWVNISNHSGGKLENVYCIDYKTGDKLIYDPHLYPDYAANKEYCIETLKSGYGVSFMHYHKLTPEEAEEGSYVFKVYAIGTDESGNEVKSMIADLEVKTDLGYHDPPRRTTGSPEEPSIELRESTQAGHWMEDPSHYEGSYYYSKGEEVRYKIIVKNDTDDPIFDVVIGYDLSPTNIAAVKLPGQEEELPYELDPEGDAHINIEVMEVGETRAFYLWCPAETEDGDKGTMEHKARMEYNGQDGKHRFVVSKPCVVNIGIDPGSGSEK